MNGMNHLSSMRMLDEGKCQSPTDSNKTDVKKHTHPQGSNESYVLGVVKRKHSSSSSELTSYTTFLGYLVCEIDAIWAPSESSTIFTITRFATISRSNEQIFLSFVYFSVVTILFTQFVDDITSHSLETQFRYNDNKWLT